MSRVFLLDGRRSSGSPAPLGPCCRRVCRLLHDHRHPPPCEAVEAVEALEAAWDFMGTCNDMYKFSIFFFQTTFRVYESLNGDKFGSVDQLKIGMRGPTKNRQTVDIRGMDSPYWFPTVWTLISNPLELWAWNSQNRSAWGGELGWCFCRTKQSAEQWLRSTPVGWWLRGSYYYLGVVSTGTSISTAVKLI